MIQERIDSPTPNGGAYAIAYYQDSDGSPIDKEFAVKVEIIEYDAADIELARTYSEVNPTATVEFDEKGVVSTLDELEAKGVDALKGALEECRDALLTRVRRADDLAAIVENLERLPRFGAVEVEIRALLDRAWEAGSRDALREVRTERRKQYAYDPSQPRAPEGSPTGGQWIEAELEPIWREVEEIRSILDRAPIGWFTSASIAGSWATRDPTRLPDRAGVGTSDIDLIVIPEQGAARFEARNAWLRRRLGEIEDRLGRAIRLSTYERPPAREGAKVVQIWSGRRVFDLEVKGAEFAFNPSQPRHPKGSPEGGQWTSSLASRGWFLEDHQERWLSSGEAELREIPTSEFSLAGEYKDVGLFPDDARVQRFVAEWAQGIRFPVIQTYLGADGKYQILDGQHRFVAWAQKNKTIPVLVSKAKEFADSFSPKSATKWLRATAFWISGILHDGLIADARRVILSGLKGGRATNLIMDALLDVFIPYLGTRAIDDEKQLLPYRLETIVRTNTTTAYNHGRLTEFMDKDVLPFLKGVRYSAVLDERTTEVCAFLDGKVFRPDSTDLEALLPPNHFNCRAIVVPVVAGEKIDESEFITAKQIAKARGLADAKFLSEG